jgi:hypothetical protein
MDAFTRKGIWWLPEEKDEAVSGTLEFDVDKGTRLRVMANVRPGDSSPKLLRMSPLDTGKLNAAWQKHFGQYKTVHIGIGGDKTQNVPWRLDHGVEGLQPRLVIVLVGNNNMFFTPETGVEAAAKGIQMCVTNVRDKFPQADGTLKGGLFTPDNIHLSQDGGYELYAGKLKPLVEKSPGKK